MGPQQTGQGILTVISGSVHSQLHQAEHGSVRAYCYATAVGEKAEVADADEALGQKVDQEAA